MRLYDSNGQQILALTRKDGKWVERSRLLDQFLMPILEKDTDARGEILEVANTMTWDRRLDEQRKTVPATSSKTIKELINDMEKA